MELEGEDLNTAEMRRLLRTLGQRASRSAEESRARELAAIDALSARERMAMALRLGRRDGQLTRSRPGRARGR